VTAKVYQFKSREDKKPRTKKQPPDVFAKTNMDIFKEVTDDVLGEWSRAAARDQLNEYIGSKIPAKARLKTDAEYIKNLNALSMIEQKLDMKVALFYPGCTAANPIGWMAAFHRGKEVFTTVPDMASEGHARSMNLVLSIAFLATLKSLGRI
jgi:hypothetical protein